jgi:hypothetical protein
MRLFFVGPRIGRFRLGASFGREDLGRGAGRSGRPAEPVTGSFVYVIRGDHNMTKIGITTNPTARIASLRTGSAFPIDYAFIGAVEGDNGPPIEAQAHQSLARHRCSGEWFDVPPETATLAVLGAASKLGQPIRQLTQEQADTVLRIAAAGSQIEASGGPIRRNLGFVLMQGAAMIASCAVAIHFGVEPMVVVIPAALVFLIMAGVTKAFG